MGYRHILNLYKEQTILLFKECYALEKIHGTSAHISFDPNGDSYVKFFSGGSSHATFIKLFDKDVLQDKFFQMFTESKVVVYGETYGGSCQGMSKVYGPNLKFIVFEVKVGDVWLDVPNAEDVALKLGLEFVDYKRIPTDLPIIDMARDFPSTQAERNGMGVQMREGVVLRPLIEVTLNNGDRVISKHKRPEFSETKTVREVSPDKLQVMLEAGKIVDEWVTEMRFQHVMDKLPECADMKDTGKVIMAMQEDVYREAKGEIVESKSVSNAIAKKTAQMFKAKVTKI